MGEVGTEAVVEPEPVIEHTDAPAHISDGILIPLRFIHESHLRRWVFLSTEQLNEMAEGSPRAVMATGAQVVEAMRSGADMTHSQLRGLDLSGQDLTGLDFSGCDMRGCILEGAVLTDADFTGALK